MSDRAVLVYLLFCLVQVPFYLTAGWAPIGFDYAAGRAETALKQPLTPEVLDQLDATLVEVESMLDLDQARDSRRARLELDLALTAWARGQAMKADKHFQSTIALYTESHGPDTFHVNAVKLRYAEFLALRYKHNEALPLFREGHQAVVDFLGPRHPFVTRMVFRQVVVLVYLGRLGEAEQLFRANQRWLERNMGHFDESFATQAGATLDILANNGRIGRPKGHNTWRDYLHLLWKQEKGKFDPGLEEERS